MSKPRLSFPLAAWILAGLIAVPIARPAWAQEADDEEIFFERVEVNLVNVDVFATDSKGNRVTDLALDDFEVYEDGQKVEITNFYAVNDRRAREVTATAARPEPAAMDKAEIAPGVPRPPHLAAEVPESQKLSVVLFIDNLNLRPFNRNKVLREIQRFLRINVTDQDRVMVVSFQRTVKVEQPFTNDLASVTRTLIELETESALGAPAQTERRDVLRSIDMAANHSTALSHVESYANRVFHDLTTSMNAMKDLVGSLGGLPGRKAFIHVSDGFPMVAADDLFQLVDRIWPDEPFSGKLIANGYSGRRMMQELDARANASRVTFYTIDATGLRSHNSLSAEYGGTNGNLSGFGSLAEIDFARFSNETESLQTMALDTGGLAIFNTNNFDDMFANIGEDFSTYYSLGYPSRFSSDGRYHSIEVKVSRKGVDLRHREGYRSRTIESIVNDSTYASLLYDRESNELGVEVEFEQPTRREDGQFLTPILIKIPLANIVLIPRETLHRGSLKVSIAVIDGKGRLSPIDLKRVPVEIPLADLETARKQYFVYTASLLMRGGPQDVAVGVRDDFSGEGSFVKAGIDISN